MCVWCVCVVCVCGVCVCGVCVLLCVVVVVCGCACACVCVYHLNRCKTSHWFFTNLQGVVAGSRVYHQRRRSGFPGDTWPDQPCVPANFLEWEEAQPKNLHVVYLIISIFWFVQLHQNLPQHFRRNHVADTILIFLNYFAEPCRRCIWGILSQPRRRFIYF